MTMARLAPGTPAARCSPAVRIKAPKRSLITCHAGQTGGDPPTTCSRRAALAMPLVAGAAASAAQLTAALAANAAGPPACADPVSTPSGLSYCELQEGAGATPAAGALIRCHYTGWLASNGRVFDSSYERGRPLAFKVGVGQVIRGWDTGILGGEGIPPMKEGGKRLLFIPPALGYGDRGAGGVIPGGATLIFEVALLPPRK